MSGTWAALAFVLAGAIPLLPLCLRPLEKHQTPWVRGIGRLLAWGLLWLAFDSSLMTLWGAVRFVPAWWAFVIGMPLLQIPAAWFSYRIVYGGEDEP